MATAIEPASKLHIVNEDPRYEQAQLLEPTSLGYILLECTVVPSKVPFVLPSSGRSELIGQLKEIASRLAKAEEVVDVHVFRSVIVPPGARFFEYVKEHPDAVQPANFDVEVLIQTTSPMTARGLLVHPEFVALGSAMREHSTKVNMLMARNGKRLGDVDLTRTDDLYLFNHFSGEEREVVRELWDYLADWYVKETGLKNSIGLVPMDDEQSDYAIVNFASWDDSLIGHFRALGRQAKLLEVHQGQPGRQHVGVDAGVLPAGLTGE
jgi:hypothetical protein